VVTPFAHRYASIIDVQRLSRRLEPGALHDAEGHAHQRLGTTGPDRAAHYLVRPDGYVAYRAAGTRLDGLDAYLQRWLNHAST
jgi:hypothetical protein